MKRVLGISVGALAIASGMVACSGNSDTGSSGGSVNAGGSAAGGLGTTGGAASGGAASGGATTTGGAANAGGSGGSESPPICGVPMGEGGAPPLPTGCVYNGDGTWIDGTSNTFAIQGSFYILEDSVAGGVIKTDTLVHSDFDPTTGSMDEPSQFMGADGPCVSGIARKVVDPNPDNDPPYSEIWGGGIGLNLNVVVNSSGTGGASGTGGESGAGGAAAGGAAAGGAAAGGAAAGGAAAGGAAAGGAAAGGAAAGGAAAGGAAAGGAAAGGAAAGGTDGAGGVEGSGGAGGGSTSTPMPYDAADHGIVGFEFLLTGDAGGADVRFKATQFDVTEDGDFCLSIKAKVGQVTRVLFSELKHQCWTGGTATKTLDVTKLGDIQWQVVTDTKADYTVSNLCVENLAPITAPVP